MIIHNIIIDMNEVKQSSWHDHWKVDEEIVAQRIMEYLTPLFGEEHLLDNEMFGYILLFLLFMWAWEVACEPI